MNQSARPPADFELRFPGQDSLAQAAAFDVHEVAFTDAVDDLFRLELVLRSRDHDVDLGKLAGSPIVLTIPAPETPLIVNALIASLGQESLEERGDSFYRLVAVPPTWLTTQRRNSRIFRQHSVVDIVVSVLAEYGGLIPPPRVRLGEHPPAREHVTQYDESDWDFVRRIVADEGILLTSAHDGSGRLALTDEVTSPEIRLFKPIPFIAESNLVAGKFHVRQARFEVAIAPSAITLRDFDYERPRLELEGAAVAEDAAKCEQPLENYGFCVGAFADGDRGRNRAQSHLELARRETRLAHFDANFSLAPGTAFRLADHARSDANVEWLVVRSELHCQALSARHVLHCTPLSQQQRPRRWEKPRMLGTQTAFVVGEPGREIDVDGQGRVCVKFHWDRRADTHSTTRRVRVSQGWAGPGYGFVCLPRVGDEVVVDFLLGDPDQPLIVGRVHNGAAPAPQSFPKDATVSTWRSRSSPGGEGYNELSFDDAAGRELVFMHAQRDVAVEVLHDVSVRVEGHVTSNVKGNATGGVVGDGSINISGSADVVVSGPLSLHAAKIDASADGDILFAAGGDRHDESGGNHFVKTNGLYVDAKGVAHFVTPNFHVYSSNILLKAGGSTIALTGGGIDITSGGPVTINGSVIKLNC